MPLTKDQVQTYIKEVGYEEETDTHYRTLCPSCKHPNRKLYIDKDSGLYQCFHCEEDLPPSAFHGASQMAKAESYRSVDMGLKEKDILNEGYVTKCIESLNDNAYRTKCYGYLMNERHLTRETIEKFKIGYDKDQQAITIPGYDKHGVRTITYRYLEGEQRYKSKGDKGTFLLEESRRMGSRECIIFEGEIDAITSRQLIPTLPAIAAQGKNVCKESLKDGLGVFDRIYICFDDGTDKEVAKLGRYLGKHRCWKVQLPRGLDLNDVAGHEEARAVYEKCLEEAKPMAPPLVVGVGDKIDECIDYFNGAKYKSHSTGFSQLDDITGGVRPGEFYVVTGDSGLGKSTFTIRLGLELAKQGFKTSICSLELPFQSHIAPKLASFLLGKNIETPKIPETEYRGCLEWMASWGNLNVVNRVGSLIRSEIKLILDEVYKKGYRCIIFDHLQFMVTKEENDEINEVVRILVDFLKSHLDFTIFLVAHPRKPVRDYKTGQPKRLTMHDLKGSASLFQEPDNVWILNKNQETGLVDLTVEKLRSDKTSISSGGKVVIYFDKNSFKYNVVHGF